MTVIAPLGKRVRQARGRLSRNRLGNQLGRTGRTVERWENDQTLPSEGDLLLLAQVLGVRIEWIKTGEGPMQAEPVPATGQVSEDLSPVDQSSSEDLEESARSVYLQLIGPGGRVMMQVDLVIMTTTKPHQIALDVKEGIG